MNNISSEYENNANNISNVSDLNLKGIQKIMLETN